jgi:hypothetical protein
MTKKSAVIICLSVLSFSAVLAQEGNVSAGGNATGSGGSSSYSVGQTFYSSITGSHRIISEGVQQPYEISIITGISEERIGLSAELYPNPVQTNLTLSIDREVAGQLDFQLCDISGKVIRQESVHQPVITIPMESLPAGSYLIRVMQKNNEMKSFKVVKNN